jgi:hypothetical protein
MTVEERLTIVEKELAELKQKLAPAKKEWIAQISGSFKGDPEFGEILRLGREIRDAEGPDDNDGDA